MKKLKKTHAQPATLATFPDPSSDDLIPESSQKGMLDLLLSLTCPNPKPTKRFCTPMNSPENLASKTTGNGNSAKPSKIGLLDISGMMTPFQRSMFHL